MSAEGAPTGPARAADPDDLVFSELKMYSDADRLAVIGDIVSFFGDDDPAKAIRGIRTVLRARAEALKPGRTA